MDDKKKYILFFLLYFFIIYSFFTLFLENYLSVFLALLISKILNLGLYNNIIFSKNIAFVIIPACTCSFEISLFLAFILATPKVSIVYKIIYALFGIIMIEFFNVIRIILIIQYHNLLNYNEIHNIISFILFPIVLILNLIWVRILKYLNVIE
ncbi:archaeosortase D [Methanocaldococcus indicus]|uniref:archaeosortase D n=1 Tax=Methanocaldococcus indicus TaxID=213231 RepID=UPI003C6D13C0